MPVETFQTLIASNRRRSFLLILCVFALFAAVGVLMGMYVADGNWPIGLAIAVAAAVIAFLASYYGGASVLLSMSGAKEVTHDQDPKLFNVMEELSLAAGMPLPRIYLIDDSAMNAFATGRDPKHAAVAITTGLRDRLNRDELQGVMAHELSHVRSYDIRYATLVATTVGLLVLMCDVFLRSSFRGGRGRSSSDSRTSNDGGAAIIIAIIAIVLAIIAPILARIIEMAISRQREYLADAGSVALTRNPEGLIGALTKLSSDTEVLEVANRATAPLYFVHPIKKFEARSSSMFDSHPPVELRIDRLKSLTV
jgi:heat shock protein HtpX